MRPEAIRKSLREAEGRLAVVHLNDGTKLPIRSAQHWMIGPEFLYVAVGREVHHVAFRNIASIALRAAAPRRRKAT